MSVTPAIVNGITSDWRERITLWFACGAESGCRSVAQHGGVAQGPWQIEPGQGVSSVCAYDPACAAKAFYQQWNVKDCVQKQGTLWQTDAKNAALNAAMCAERPGARYNPTQIETGWNMAVSNVAIPGSTGNTSNIDGGQIAACVAFPALCAAIAGGNAVTSGAANNIAGQLTSTAGNAFTGVVNAALGADWPLRGLAIMSGIIMIYMGIFTVINVPQIVQQAAPLAAAA